MPVDPARAARFRGDFITNPAWGEMMIELKEMAQKEHIALQGAARGGDITKINHQMGVVDGIERVILRLNNLREECEQAMAEGSADVPVAA